MNTSISNKKLILLFVLLSAWGLSKSNAATILNGSFEGYPPDGSSDFTSEAPTDWGASVSAPYWIPNGSSDFPQGAEDGSAFIGMQDGAGTTSYVYQTLNLTVGQTYLVSYYVQARDTDAESGTYTVDIGGEGATGDVSGNPTLAWTKETEQFTATITNPGINLEWDPANDGSIVLFDNVRVTAAPESKTSILLMMGLAGTALVYRFKKITA